MQKGVERSGRFEVNKERKVFIKHLTEAKFRSEWEMSGMGASVALASGFFKTPSIKHAEPEKCVLEFELLTQTATLRKYFIQMAGFGASNEQKVKLERLFERVGRSLASVHEMGKTDDSVTKIAFPDGFIENRFSEESVLIHGDFTLGNLLYDEETDELQIIDWSVSPVFDFAANYGPRYWDLSFFISSLFFCSYSTYFSFDLRNYLIQCFLKAYLSKTNLDKNTFAKALGDFVASYNYYDLYDTQKKVKRTLSEQFLIKRSKLKMGELIERLPSLLS